MKQKILILGGVGFIGRSFVEWAVESGKYDVYATFHDKEPFITNGHMWHSSLSPVTWQKVDLRTAGNADSVIAGKDIVIHAAAVTSGAKDITERPWIHTADNAIMGSHIFRAAFERKVKHVIFFSCTTMYPDGLVDESIPLAPNAKYFGVAHTKLYLERMCEFYAGLGDTKFTAIRHSNVYGAWDKYDLEKGHVFAATVRKVMDAEKEIAVWGDGTETRDLLCIDDLTGFVECALGRQADNYGLYNCGGESVSVSDMVKEIIRASDKNLAIRYDTGKPTIKTHISLDCSLAQRHLGWVRKVALKEGIEKTLKMYYYNRAIAALEGN